MDERCDATLLTGTPQTIRNTDWNSLRERLAAVRLLCLDVDGVLTDGTVDLGDDGTERKRFHVSDGLGLTLLQQEGLQVAWITGRKSRVVELRARELQIAHVRQGVRDKGAVLRDLADELGLDAAQIAFVGDDWNDLPAFAEVGLRIAVANATDEVKQRADIVTLRTGGAGAVREVCDALLAAGTGSEAVLARYLSHLRDPEVGSPATLQAVSPTLSEQ